MRCSIAALALSLFAGLASAQVLDFDSACASPPCPIGSLYASSGVTFSPNNSPIVATGTNGLNGPTGGGRYLSIASFPYQTTVSLARQATYFSVRLSRANTSSGAVTVNVTGLKGGVPVSSQNVILTHVDTWSSATAIVAGGFDTLFLDPSGDGANLTFGIDGLQFGGTCNGFSDVEPSDSFCNAAEWLANRGITLGCSSGRYCPTDSVTRGQMALFMQRLGDALAGQTVRTLAAFSGNLSISAWAPTCATDIIPASPYPRLATVWATSLVFNTAALANVQGKVLFSTNSGVSWQEESGFYMAGGTSPTQYVTVVDNGVIPLSAGTAYRFAMGIRGSAGVVNTNCELIARIDPARSAAVAPFDETTQQVQPR